MLSRMMELIRRGLRDVQPAMSRLRGLLLSSLSLTLAALALAAFLVSRLIVGIEPGQGAVRVNRLTGSVAVLSEGWSVAIPGVTRLVRYPLREQVFRSEQGATAKGPAPFQSMEGLSVGADISVRYSLDPAKVREIALRLPEDIGQELIEPMIGATIYHVLAQHTVREIFSTGRHKIEEAIKNELKDRLAPDGSSSAPSSSGTWTCLRSTVPEWNGY
jgi:regulator of protease activity HflC (stomatin/prohibitin superfamily)